MRSKNGRFLSTACGRGHLYTEETVYVKKNGARDCKRCNADRMKARYNARRLDIVECDCGLEKLRYQVSCEDCRVLDDRKLPGNYKETVFKAIQGAAQITVKELARKTSYKEWTIYQAISQLRRDGAVKTTGWDHTSDTNRPHKLWSPNLS